ncbi:hypothetical protein [Atlantibacter sp.]|uniref:hypothetical protein n=1 Tax=Atlantibacter sp. TaxID=1903473 RepID=UPI00289F3668|nr:hypothetical protein [Atlantibacter sp.]
MLPDFLVAARYVISPTTNPPAPDSTDDNFTQELPDIREHEKDILSRTTLAGQRSHALLEERDRHIKERLFCVAKIDTYAQVLNNLLEHQKISPEEISQLIQEQTALINAQGKKIWLNLITRESTEPVFYQLGDK